MVFPEKPTAAELFEATEELAFAGLVVRWWSENQEVGIRYITDAGTKVLEDLEKRLLYDSENNRRGAILEQKALKSQPLETEE